eukprot:3645454-Prymnesium_polylepis.1
MAKPEAGASTSSQEESPEMKEMKAKLAAADAAKAAAEEGKRVAEEDKKESAKDARIREMEIDLAAERAKARQRPTQPSPPWSRAARTPICNRLPTST